MIKLMNPNSDIARIYLSRKEELNSFECVLTSEEGLLILARRVDEDYEQQLRVIESVKEFKERRRND